MGNQDEDAGSTAIFSSHRRALGTAFSQRDGAEAEEAEAEEAEAEAAAAAAGRENSHFCFAFGSRSSDSVKIWHGHTT